MEQHGAVGRSHLGDLLTAGPVTREGFGSNVSIERGQFFIIDAHIGTSITERNALQGQEHLLVVAVALYRKDKDFAITSIALSYDTIVTLVGFGGSSPSTFTGLLVAVSEDVEQATARCTAGKKNAAVGKFFNFRFVATGAREGIRSAQHMPSRTEVVGEEDAVAAVASSHGSIDAMVCAVLDGGALAEFTRTYEKALDLTIFTIVEKAIHLVGDVFVRLPSPTFIVADKAYDGKGISLAVISVSIRHLAGYAKHQHIVGFAVGHDSGIAKATSKGRAVAISIGNGHSVRPSGPVVVGGAKLDVHFTKADVVSVGAVVAESQQTAALGFCHRGDAERFLPGLSGVEIFRGVGNSTFGHCHFHIFNERK